MKKMNKMILLTSVFVITLGIIIPIANIQGYMVFPFMTTEKRDIPVVFYRLYDPAGSDSYQEISVGYSLETSFELEVKGGGSSCTRTVSVSMEMEESTKTYTGSDSSKNGIGKGDVLIGKAFEATIKVSGHYEYRFGQQRTVIDSITIQSIDWDESWEFAYSPVDFQDVFDMTPPNPSNDMNSYSKKKISVSAGYQKDYNYQLTAEESISLEVGCEFSYCGIEFGVSATSTITASQTVSTGIHLEDDSNRINHELYFGTGFSQDSNNFFGQSLIAWFGTY